MKRNYDRVMNELTAEINRDYYIQQKNMSSFTSVNEPEDTRKRSLIASIISNHELNIIS